MILAELLEQLDSPWWVTAITGSGGALIIQFLWIRNLASSIKKKDQELMEISKQSIECIAIILERQNQEKPWKDKLEKLIEEIHHCIKG